MNYNCHSTSIYEVQYDWKRMEGRGTIFLSLTIVVDMQPENGLYDGL